MADVSGLNLTYLSLGAQALFSIILGSFKSLRVRPSAYRICFKNARVLTSCSDARVYHCQAEKASCSC